MRVVFVTRRYWPAIGGVERVAMSLGAALRELGDEVAVVAQRVDGGHHGAMTHVLREAPPFAPFEHDGISVRQLRLPPRARARLAPFAIELVPLAARLSLRRLRAGTSRWYSAAARPYLEPLLAGADVVHVLGGDLLAAAAVDTAHGLGLPAVVSPFAHPPDWGMDAASVRAYREADGVLATLEPDAQAYRAAGVPAGRLHLPGLPVPAVRAPGEPDSEPLVLFLGGRRANKGVELLLEAAPALWEAQPRARIAFVGPGPPLAATDPRILDVGPVSEEDRGRWLARARMLCLPSDSESFGLVVAEAWSAGVPAVVSDIPVLSALVAAGGGGLAVPREPRALGAALARLAGDAGEARRLGESGRAYWEQAHRPEAVAQRHREVYREAGERLRPARARSH